MAGDAPVGRHPACPHLGDDACGYADANDHDDLRRDPAFKLACGRLPESGGGRASQPTISRWENAPDLRTLLRLGYAMIDLWCRGHHRPPTNITLDIDDTVDMVAHGHQQLSLLRVNDQRCFLPGSMYTTRTVVTAWRCCCDLAREATLSSETPLRRIGIRISIRMELLQQTLSEHPGQQLDHLQQIRIQPAGLEPFTQIQAASDYFVTIPEWWLSWPTRRRALPGR